jgi:hypothetical protein
VTLLVEIAERGGWRRLGELGADDPAGSLSPNTEEGREIIQFRCNGDHSVIERSIGGADEEIGMVRKVTTLGFEPVARLEPGQKVDLWVRTDLARKAARIRFRHQRPSGAA